MSSPYRTGWLGREATAAWAFLSPALLLLGVFLFWPIGYLLYLSFTSGLFDQAGPQWVGGRNYLRLVLDPDFRQVLGNTLYFTAATVIPSILLPLPIAIGLNQTLPLRGLLRAGYFIPAIASLVAVGLGFRWIFQQQGPLNQLLMALGGEPIAWLSSTVWAMPVLIGLSVWKQLGFNMLLFLAGLQAIPQQRYEAAVLDGAGALARFWHVTLPGLKSTLVFATVTTAIFSLRSFEQVYIVTGGGPLNSTNLMVHYIYQQAFARFDFGYAAAAAVVLLAMAGALVYWQLRSWGDAA
ncbi:MAG: sugar ABC transporter permease [Cyanobacteria bacterium QS_8_64_29]|nr:MAG: sugar ABC transporter permease [Cyanobacteria bacterium QS_8_64_29]